MPITVECEKCGFKVDDWPGNPRLEAPDGFQFYPGQVIVADSYCTAFSYLFTFKLMLCDKCFYALCKFEEGACYTGREKLLKMIPTRKPKRRTKPGKPKKAGKQYNGS